MHTTTNLFSTSLLERAKDISSLSLTLRFVPWIIFRILVEDVERLESVGEENAFLVALCDVTHSAGKKEETTSADCLVRDVIPSNQHRTLHYHDPHVIGVPMHGNGVALRKPRIKCVVAFGWDPIDIGRIRPWRERILRLPLKVVQVGRDHLITDSDVPEPIPIVR